MAADARRGDLVDVERPLFGFLRFFGAEVFAFGNFTQTVYLTSPFRLLKKAPFLLPAGQTWAGFAFRESPQAM